MLLCYARTLVATHRDALDRAVGLETLGNQIHKFESDLRVDITVGALSEGERCSVMADLDRVRSVYEKDLKYISEFGQHAMWLANEIDNFVTIKAKADFVREDLAPLVLMSQRRLSPHEQEKKSKANHHWQDSAAGLYKIARLMPFPQAVPGFIRPPCSDGGRGHSVTFGADHTPGQELKSSTMSFWKSLSPLPKSEPSQAPGANSDLQRSLITNKVLELPLGTLQGDAANQTVSSYTHDDSQASLVQGGTCKDIVPASRDAISSSPSSSDCTAVDLVDPGRDYSPTLSVESPRSLLRPIRPVHNDESCHGANQNLCNCGLVMLADAANIAPISNSKHE